MEIVYALVMMTVLIVFYGIVMTENNRTPLPEGCEQLLEGCASCHDITCGHYDTTRKKED